jgi:hypothetical protein
MVFTPHVSMIGELTEINQAPKTDFTARHNSDSIRLSMNLNFFPS